jgi:hypothetical protein
MSHIAKVALKVKSLSALEAAAKEIGCDYRRNQKDFLWYAGKRNPCSHAIGVPGKKDAYEVGIIHEKDGSYSLQFDPYGGGLGLVDKIGRDACKLKQAYAKHVAIGYARKKGMVMRQSVRADGTIEVVMEG